METDGRNSDSDMTTVKLKGISDGEETTIQKWFLNPWSKRSCDGQGPAGFQLGDLLPAQFRD